VTQRTKVAGSNFGPDWNGQRCGAHARTTGEPCRSPAVTSSQRCRMHGGAKGSGAPPGERNGAYKHGRFTGPSLEAEKATGAALRVVGKWLTARENGNIALEQHLRIEAVLALRRSRAQRER
jgi:hypothetical protein